MRRHFAAATAVAGLFLAQLTTPGTYNLGTPQTPGTRLPESSPGTAILTPQALPPSAPGPAGPAITPAPVGAAPTGPAYSFGAAPPPIVSPGR